MVDDKKDYNPAALAEAWHNALALAKEFHKTWTERGEQVVKRYKDERGGSEKQERRFNVLWSNIQTLLPATYSKPPKPEVERRHKDNDPVGRTASEILERALCFELETSEDFNEAVKAALLDRLLPGRGVAWVRLETKTKNTQQGEVQYECTPIDYVFWGDFLCQPARTWSEVNWVARRVYMSKADVKRRFGDEFADVPLTHEPVGFDGDNKGGKDTEALKKAQIWEIWDRDTKKVCWIAHGYDKALDCINDPYGLDNFFPCPKPLFSTQTTDTILPIPDFSLYQDQAREIDMLTARIGLLTKALKVVGMYDAKQIGIQRTVLESGENVLIPVESWAALTERGGVRGAIEYLPLDQIILALNNCYAARDRAVQVVYEVTGLSDIIRGSSNASETATAQQIKSNFASLRLKNLQRDVAMFTTELLRIRAQLMCDFYSAQTLIECSGIQMTQDAEFAEPALRLIASEQARNYKINIASDSLVDIDEAQEKQDRIEFLTATGGFLEKALPTAQQVPELGPLLAEMLLFGVRAFKAGRPLENAFDAAMDKLKQPKQEQPQGPSPEEIQAQQQMQVEQAKLQAQQTDAQMQMQIEQAKLQMQMQMKQMEIESMLQLEQIKQEAENQRYQASLAAEQETRLQIAVIEAQNNQQVGGVE